MARSLSAATIIRQAREIADQQTAAASVARVTDTECLGQLNTLLGIWHGMLVKAVPERFEEEQTITADGATSYDLPADHFLTLGVDALWGTQRMPLERIQYQERTRYEATGSDAEGYYLKAATVVLVPAPSSGTYYHQYVTAAPTFTATSDTVDCVNGWESWLVYGLAIHMLGKEESDATLWVAKQLEVKAEIDAAAADREAARPMRVVDTRLARY